MNFSERLKILRNETNLSQAELAQAVGVSQQCVSEWERNKTQPTLSYIVKMADIFECSADYVICRKDEK